MCVHYDFDADRDLRVCAAFPDGVPDEIVRLGFDHRNPYEGDNGIRFTPDGPVDVAEIEAILATAAEMRARRTAS